jgi:hypothetical protein
MAKRYLHVTAALRQDIAQRLEVSFWGTTDTTNETSQADHQEESE